MEVTKQEYLDYIKNYPNELYVVETEVCEPKLKSHIDSKTGLTIATIAKDWMSDMGEVAEVGSEKFWKYYVIDKE